VSELVVADVKRNEKKGGEHTCVYFWRITSNASPISLGYSGLGSSEDSKEEDVCTGFAFPLVRLVVVPPRTGAPPDDTAFFNISFSIVNK